MLKSLIKLCQPKGRQVKQTKKSNLNFVQKNISVSFLTLVAALPGIAEETASLSFCKSKADCQMVDAGCGQPVAINKNSSPALKAKECDASMNFEEQVKKYELKCVSERCILVPRKDSR